MTQPLSLDHARIYDLAQAMEQGMPQSPNHPPFRMALARRHGDAYRPDGGSSANEMIVTGGHVGTHLDALCHVSHGGRLHGDLDAYEAQRGGRFSSLGIDTVAPIVGRGILLDVATHLGVDVLPGGYPVTGDDLQMTVKAEGVEIRPGDSVLVRTGWSRYWGDPAAFVGLDSGVPGPDESAAHWLAGFGIRLAGSDTIAYEVIPPGVGHRDLPVHRVFLVERGVHICEVMQLEDLAADRCYEFSLVVAPLKIKGATGSPVRPVALL